jgi:hypothetical protein
MALPVGGNGGMLTLRSTTTLSSILDLSSPQTVSISFLSTCRQEEKPVCVVADQA